jgi:hypothetical protein
VEVLSHLNKCPLHGLPITYFDDSANNKEDPEEIIDCELVSVSYACDSCVDENRGSFTLIDKDNLLNVH